jgi:hypothetical protein
MGICYSLDSVRLSQLQPRKSRPWLALITLMMAGQV